MKQPSAWTSVHYKVLDASCDCSNLPELMQEHQFRGFPGGDTRIPATSRDETQAALLDLIDAGVVDVFDGDVRLTRAQATEVVRDDSSWTFDMRGADVEVVENDRSGEFLRNRPPDRDPYVPLGETD